jgi:hypothetical protein
MPRKRKPGPRTKTGRPSRAYATIARDYGTPQIQAKRKAAVGENADPTQAASAPGILCEHGHIDHQQRDILFRYRQLRGAVFGPPWPGNTSGSDASDKWLAKRKLEFEDMNRRMTHDQRHIVRAVGVFDRILKLPQENGAYFLLLQGVNALLGRATKAAA